MGRVVAPLRVMGASIDGRSGAQRAPLVVRGGALHGVRYELPVASAQVKSAVLLAGLQADGATEVVSPGASRDHTERMLAALGVPVRVDGLSVRVERGAPRSFDLDVPGDPSSAAFFAVAAAITRGSDVVLEGVSCNPTRVGFVTVMKRMGADIELTPTGEVCGEPVGELRVRSSQLEGTTIAGAEIPNVIDEIPALAVAAAFAEGVTDVRDAAELVVKESNRIGTIRDELAKLGVGVEARADGLSIRGGRANAAVFDSHGDHRIAMALAVAANALGGGLDGAALERGHIVVSGVCPGSRTPDRGPRPVTTVVAIDGPSGSGKSTVARGVAARLGLSVLDTGAMYRAVTLAVIEADVALDDERAAATVARASTITVEDGVTMLDGRDVSAEIRGPLVTGAVSTVSAHAAVREILVAYQRDWVARHGGGVVEGRDIGTVVFPDATVKVYLDASDEERARRRQRDEVAAARSVAVEEVKAALDRRDAIDSGRAISPLRAADDAIVIDSTHLDVDTIVASVAARARAAEAT